VNGPLSRYNFATTHLSELKILYSNSTIKSVPATERDKGDRELETADRAGGVDLRRLPYQTMYGVLSCREEVSCLHNGNPVLTFLPSLVYQST